MSGDRGCLRSAGLEERRQRERLCTAFVRSVSDRGYEATTVARVAELSGCSERTFHRYYEDLADLFRDTCSHTLQESRSATVAAWLMVHGWSERLRRSCEALLRHVEEHPDAAKAVLVTSLTGGIEVAQHVRDTVAFHERALVTAFQLHPSGFPTSRLTPRALTGGVRHVLYLKMRGRHDRLLPLAGDLHRWIECHRSAAAARLPVVQREPRRSHEALWGASASAPPAPRRSLAGFDRADERAYVLDTLVQLMLQEGRDALDDATVARFAGISTARFLAEYGGLVGCLEQLLGRYVDEAGAALAAGAARGRSWPESVRLAVLECMRHLASEPRLTRIALLRLSLVPDLASARHAALPQRIVSCALDQAPFARQGGSFVAEALAGAVGELLAWAAAGEMLDQLPALGEHIAFFLLAPDLGGEAAASSIIASAAAERLSRSSLR